jgi:hypothetical protein
MAQANSPVPEGMTYQTLNNGDKLPIAGMGLW